MGRIFTLRQIIGFVKDKASVSKAAILSNPSSSTLHLAVLRATTHSPLPPSDDGTLTALLILGDSSRATASAIITVLKNRLHRTSNCVVALKCLLIIHHIIKRGPFILQDQLSIFAAAGQNNLKLSAFRDGATAATWVLSAWVRWYARYLETLLLTSRVLGYFLCSSSNTIIKEIQEQRIPFLLNSDLIKDIDFLVLLLEEICKIPDSFLAEEDIFVKEIARLSFDDYFSTVNEILLRTEDLKQRLGCLSFGDSVELTCSLKRLQDQKERLSDIYPINKTSVTMMWASIEELKDGIENLKVCRDGGNLLAFSRRRYKMSESARLEDRVPQKRDSFQFQSSLVIEFIALTQLLIFCWSISPSCQEPRLSNFGNL